MPIIFPNFKVLASLHDFCLYLSNSCREYYPLTIPVKYYLQSRDLNFAAGSCLG